MKELYDAKKDPEFQKPYVDIDEWREDAVRYRYIHGGFEGTDTRFSFFFPDKEQYKGRFYHFMAPAPGSENASILREGEEDKIAFAITHGAYFVETNMGVTSPFAPVSDPTLIYRSSAAAAEYSRVKAAELYGEHRPFGYVYGGSGGGYKSTSCLESATAWDGAAPYIIGSPMAIPNVFSVRALARRILRNKLHLIVDAMEPGGDKDFIEKLSEEERSVWNEVTQMGYPTRSWFFYETMDDGALPVLTPGIERIDSTYYKDFWTLPGYEGTNPNGSAAKDRIFFETAIADIHVPERDGEIKPDADESGADNSWKQNRGDKGLSSRPMLRLDNAPTGDLYLYGTKIVFVTGEAAGYSVPLESLDNKTAVIGAGFGQPDILENLLKVKTGDKIRLDNSDYIAIQYYHRHQVPDSSYPVWNQFLDKNGDPLYPQRPMLVGPMISAGGAGSLQSGRFNGKMIVLAALMDESAFPWQADWYRQRVKEALGDNTDDSFRLWFMDNALHDDRYTTTDELHLISYLGALHQALLDLSDWVENGTVPAETSVYAVENGQMVVPATADERKGVQPVIRLKVNGGEAAHISCGEAAYFNADVSLPAGTGKLTSAEWSFEGEGYTDEGTFSGMSADGASATVEAVYHFNKPGTYFAVLRVKAQRHGNAGCIFTQVKNLCRVRVVVK